MSRLPSSRAAIVALAASAVASLGPFGASEVHAQAAMRPAGVQTSVGGPPPRPTPPSRAASASRPDLPADVYRPGYGAVGTSISYLPGPYESVRYAGRLYLYSFGVFYSAEAGGYVVANPPLGAVVKSLVDATEVVRVDGRTFYYYHGIFYAAGRKRGTFEVVEAPLGAVVGHVPAWAEVVVEDDVVHYVVRGVYYRPMKDENGQYEVIRTP